MKTKKLSYSEIIVKLLESEPTRWFMSWELIKVNTPWGWLGSNADRLARRLAEDEIIERIGREQGSFYAKYRAKILPKPIPSPLSKQMSFNQENVKIKV